MNAETKTPKDRRIEEILDLIMQMASGHLQAEGTLSKRGDDLDGIICGLNMLGEELYASTVSRDYVDNIIKSMVDMLIVVNPDTSIQTVNEATLALLGYQEDELIGKPLRIIFAVDEDEEEKDLFKRSGIEDLIQKGSIRNIERTCVIKDGRKIPVLFSGSVMRDNEGEIQGIVCVARDITERKRAEETLGKSEERFQSLLVSVNDVVWAAKMDGSGILYLNPAAERVYGQPYSELLVNPNFWIETVYPDDRERVQQSARELFEQGHSKAEHRIVRPDGEVRWLSGRASIVYDEAGEPVQIVGIATDITDRKLAEEKLEKYRHHLEELVEERTSELEMINEQLQQEITERKRPEEVLRESEERYRSLYIKTPAMLHSIDGNGRLLSVSDRWLEVLGYERSEVMGRKSIDFLTEESQRYAETVALPEFFKTGFARDISYQFVKKNGETVDILLSGIIEYNEKGRFIKGHGVLEDVTERKKAEEELGKLERQQMAAEKDIALGQVAAGVAHEINNPLASITNCFHIVKGALPQAHGTEKFVRFIDRDIERIAAIVRKMYDLYQPPQGEGSPISINEVLGDILTAMEGARSAAAIELQDERCAGNIDVLLPAGQLAQIFTNIMNNAVDAMQEGGRLHVKTGRENDHLLVEVSDSGAGIPLDVLPHIFEPFFSTKSPGIVKGRRMGLGLSITRSLVNSLEGQISVKSEPGAGTCVTVSLPISPYTKSEEGTSHE